MNTNTYKLSALTLALGTALAVSTSAGAAGNPFETKQLSGGYMQLADASTAEGKCGGSKSAGEGKCGGSKSAGEGKCGGAQGKSISVLEGKCGEGKCGSNRVRQMMDKNGDGRIDRTEYTNWSVQRANTSAEQANAEFDKMAHGADSVSAEDAYQSFLLWESYTD